MDHSQALQRILQIYGHLQSVTDSQSRAPGSAPGPVLPSCCKAHGAIPFLPNRGGQPVVIGGMVMDVQGMTAKDQVLQRGTTTPGKVSFSTVHLSGWSGQVTLTTTTPGK